MVRPPWIPQRSCVAWRRFGGKGENSNGRRHVPFRSSFPLPPRDAAPASGSVPRGSLRVACRQLLPVRLESGMFHRFSAPAISSRRLIMSACPRGGRLMASPSLAKAFPAANGRRDHLLGPRIAGGGIDPQTILRGKQREAGPRR